MVSRERDPPVLDLEVRDPVDALARIDHARPANQNAASGHDASAPAPVRRYSTAIRIATPFVTWSRIRE